MISKLELQSIIEKYHLKGLIENVKWEINSDKQLNIDFMAPTREMVGKVTYSGFPLPESAIGISNTTQLDKLLAITSGDLMLDYIKEHKIVTKLIIADSQFNLNYSLADLLTIPKPGGYNGPEEYEIETVLESETINALIKAKNALTNSENVVIKSGTTLEDDYQLEFTFGGDVEYANKVSYSIQNITPNSPANFTLTYNSDLIKDILVCNKNAEEGKLHINTSGLMKLIFNHNNLQSVYYIVAKEN
jgi:hypothetical protein